MSEQKRSGNSSGNKASSHQSGHGNLTLFIIGAIVTAIATALILPSLLEKETALSIFHGIGIGGEVFLRALMMMVVPLVVASVMSGILGLGDIRKLGKPGFVAVGYYVCTTVLAVVVGLMVVNVINPGGEGSTSPTDTTAQQVVAESEEVVVTAADKTHLLDKLETQTGMEKEKIAKIFPELEGGLPGNEPGIWMILGNLVLMLFTDNLLHAAATTNLLPLIVFAIIFAGMLTTMGERVSAITNMIGQANEAMMSFVMLLMNVAPLGIFCLVASKFGTAQANGQFLEVIKSTSGFIITVLLGLGFHALVTLPAIYFFFTRKNPYVFIKSMSRALLTAFSTASSSATLPVTMDCAAEAGVSKRSTDFVLPLGATINMDGTALYEAAAAIFIANLDPNVTLTFVDQIVIAVTATLAAIGAAGIPEAGLVTMLMVLNAVGLSPEYIGSILAIDWLLDRFRTATNTLGDSIGAAIVDQSFDK